MHAGYHALNSLRIEKAYRHWGHDITIDDTPLEAGLGFAVKMNKPGGFLGRGALAATRAEGPARHLLQFRLDDPDPLLYHNEPIWSGDRIAGYISSGAYGYTLGAAIGLGYVSCEPGQSAADLAAAAYEIEIAGTRFAAQASHRPLYDPDSRRIRA